MRNITKALSGLGGFLVLITTSYFLVLYQDLTQLILVLGSVGIMVLAAFMYLYEWMKDKDEEQKENVETTDRLKMYIKEVEEKIK